METLNAISQTTATTSENFTGPYDIKNWQEKTDALHATLWNIADAPLSIALNNDPAWQVSSDWMLVTAEADGIVTFNWNCNQADGSVYHCYFINNGQDYKTQLNNNASSGTSSFYVSQGSTFGFQLIADQPGPASFTISVFSAPVGISENFAGPYSIQNWKETTDALHATLWDIANVPASVTLNNDPEWEVSSDWMLVTAMADGMVTFDWDCTQADGSTYHCYFINDRHGAKIQLNSNTSSGKSSFYVSQGSTFGFQLIADQPGPVSFTISNFSAPGL